MNKLLHKKILVAPLDWGLGHATRCIPIIKHLKALDCEVIIAGTPTQGKLLKQQFPQNLFLPISGYNITYTKHRSLLPVKMLAQLPKIFSSIKKEHRWLQKIIQQHKIDVVISDNRYGLYSNLVPCYFITHQLQVITANKWMDKLARIINYRYINRFTACWVPDEKEEPSLAEKLSHPETMPKIPVHYIGPLSRFEKGETREIKYTWMMILSGPEPQRTLLEMKFLLSAGSMQGEVLLVRGKPGSEEKIPVPGNCTVYNHLPTEEMLHAIQSSEYIISRCGYTTVMEMFSLQKKCIFIPTPGQTEQEYLAKHLMNQQWCYTFLQHQPFIENIEKARTFNFIQPHIKPNQFYDVLAALSGEL